VKLDLFVRGDFSVLQDVFHAAMAAGCFHALNLYLYAAAH
jgi:hypothetical protein